MLFGANGREWIIDYGIQNGDALEKEQVDFFASFFLSHNHIFDVKKKLYTLYLSLRKLTFTFSMCTEEFQKILVYVLTR